ncbi:MAG: tRNA (adenosine(37)-N6)-threonylcarbamoyltransferase complex transferase subunit TsaD [Holosporales bacterium]|jgi:N6-L-threonylcarbamoyladenine synthase|nr:tRNA (adenosine(37)-N6)-threonylcarbamoyltransferase complex transferase subunit TsaD [Holosporales bacterium]
MIVLAIESSCDETSSSVVCDNIDCNKRILSNIINSQIHIHSKYGGVIPEYAARNHLDCIDAVINQSLKYANVSLNEIEIITATAGPGLIGGLLVGMVTAKSIALFAKKPFMAINHLEGHLLTTRLCYDVEMPYLTLLASGGHFSFIEVLGIGNYKILGETLDDAAGEAFDKVAKMLGFPYPGGPSIQEAAKKGDKNRFYYTIPLAKRAGCDASFSGIKTATRLHIQKISELTEQDKFDIAASFQNIVSSFILKQLKKAHKMTSSDIKNIVISGGVAANIEIRQKIQEFCLEQNLNYYVPPIELCSDNAAMIGWAAIERIRSGYCYSSLNAKTRPKWPL